MCSCMDNIPPPPAPPVLPVSGPGQAQTPEPAPEQSADES
jgi:hypothetical protein